MCIRYSHLLLSYAYDSASAGRRSRPNSIPSDETDTREPIGPNRTRCSLGNLAILTVGRSLRESVYSLDQVRTGLENPNSAIRELNSLYWDRAGRRAYNPAGIDVFAADWDTLLILDGCRYDALSRAIDAFDIDGDLEARVSRGSATAEWLRGNFHGKTLDDTVYVTGSTMLYQETVFREQVDVALHDVIDVWSGDIQYGEDGVAPKAVAAETRAAAERYPNKRLVAHFVQPHAPYIGRRGREVFPDYRPNPLSERFRGEIETDASTLRALYHENLDVVLEEVEALVDDLSGKTVITADHGMLLGERERPIPIKSFGHPPRMYVEEMVRVPWFVVNHETRRRIVAGDTAAGYERKRDDDLDEQARDHLAQLGYR